MKRVLEDIEFGCTINPIDRQMKLGQYKLKTKKEKEKEKEKEEGKRGAPTAAATTTTEKRETFGAEEKLPAKGEWRERETDHDR